MMTRAPAPLATALALLLVASAASAAAPAGLEAQPPAVADTAVTPAPETGYSATGAPAAVAPQRPDFLFGRPTVTLGLRAGMTRARAGSDIFDFITDELTLDRGDFNAVSLGAEAEVWLHPRLDLVLGLGYSNASARSEYRDWVEEVDGEDVPIRQRTSLRQVPLTGGLKYYLTQRGHSIGRFAWIPERTAFYAGAGGGLVRHSFRQAGEFVEFDEDGDAWIIEGDVESSGWSPTGQIFAGVDYSLGPRAVVSAEARQSWASSEMGQDFDGHEPIDLSGLQFTLGFRWRL